ncbi:GlcNAc-transferase family protein [Jiulongibacter sediminis]|uniref:GlcNAc-transferase family protein n=1 Tax=Jiulongibacter sediminis TaxID=1605367 RepID=UPI0026E9B5AB|nr:GlcNAc-transferase family protein [Jiulongibacter sediminis]
MPTNKPQTEKNSIFVQIASYRDPQLVPTLDDLLGKADKPQNLNITVAWQTSEEDTWDKPDKYFSQTNIQFLKIPFQEAQGVCWARNWVQQHYRGEKYTLQLDSHHRFVQGWDTLLITMLESLRAQGVEKPLLTAYVPSFDPENDPEGRIQEPWKMDFDRFTPEGIIFFLPSTIEDSKSLTHPVPARFYSAHFAFTLGAFSLEVQHDPSFYFHGEEISIAVRAYTHGYDLYHPHRLVAWHEYTRKGRTKHWDDKENWHVANQYTHKRVKQLLGIDGESFTNDFGKYGFGTQRTLSDYERYAGIRFRDRGVQRHTLDRKPAPNPGVEDYDNSFFTIFEHCIDIHKSALPEQDYEFLVVAFLDESGADLYRKDADKEEVKTIFNTSEDWLNIWRKYTGPVPAKWRVWPYSASKGWCDRIEGTL